MERLRECTTAGTYTLKMHHSLHGQWHSQDFSMGGGGGQRERAKQVEDVGGGVPLPW